MNTSKRRLAVAGIISLSLLAAACGDDDKDTTTSTSAASSTSAAGGDSSTSAAPSSSAETSSSASSTASSSSSSTSGSTAVTVDLAKLEGKIVGSGATFPKSFYDEAIAELKDKAPKLEIEYGGGGSGKGRSDLQTKVVDFAGTDSVVKDEDKPKFTGGDFVYVPTVIAPITVSYNVSGVDKLQLSPDTIAKIFQAEITKWDDPAIAADNQGAKLPSTPIVVAHRSDGSGTTDNFTKFLNAASGEKGSGVWKLKSGSEVEWPASTQGADGNSGVAQIVKSTDGAIGYVDLSDAKENGLKFAAVKNKAGKFVEPTLEATTAAAEGAQIKDDLTFFIGWADGDAAYPIAAQTWIIAYTKQDDAKKAEATRGFLTWLLTDGQKMAEDIDFAPLPAELQKKALDNVAKIGA